VLKSQRKASCARAREDEMVEVWLLMVAILGPELGDIRFYHPRVEFPTMASCRRQAAQVRRDYTDDVHQVVTACARPTDAPA
jgi:hypothetical protein